MKIILFQPQIPQNTGNIVRTCSVSGADLILVKPLGFSISNRHLKRAGLDYWDEVNIEVIADLEGYLVSTPFPFYFLSSHANKLYTDVQYNESDLLIFGSETKGLDPLFLQKYPEKFLKVPMKTNSRCLNLSNTVSIVLYEAWRQQGFM